jgi:hypothetical protein
LRGIDNLSEVIGAAPRRHASSCPFNDAKLLLHQEEVWPFYSTEGISDLLDQLRDILLAVARGPDALDVYTTLPKGKALRVFAHSLAGQQ